ncbi:ImcF-related family protein [Pandoraea sp.]|uniref:ImcF-related family protein n=1 Tax=Pandoraea sp. TaxID=1883445 RepID=UPI0035AF761F
MDELRLTHGWRWRYRCSWLLLCGEDTLIEDAAPGLKRSGVMMLNDTVLLHASPDGIETAQWRRQIRHLRRRRPIDRLIYLVSLGEPPPANDPMPRSLATLCADLGWAAPVTFVHAVPADGEQPEAFSAIGAFVPTTRRRDKRNMPLSEPLETVQLRTADVGTYLCGKLGQRYLAQVSSYVGVQRERIIKHWEALAATPWQRSPLAGVLFAPVFATPEATAVPIPVEEPLGNATATSPILPDFRLKQPRSYAPVWRAVADNRCAGRRVGFHWPNALATLVTAGTVAWCVWMTVSFVGNRRLIDSARDVVQSALDARPHTVDAWRTQLALQQMIDTLEYRQQHGAPWYLRAGLSRNDAILARLWHPYQTVATRNLQVPLVKAIGEQLDLAGEARADSLQTKEARTNTYNTLKTYLMLGEPTRADAQFLQRQIMALWPSPVAMLTGEYEDTGHRLAAFYADHLAHHPEWAVQVDNRWVAPARNMLVTQMGLASADDAVYDAILEEVKGKYAEASLQTLLKGADARGLFTTSETVPGVYTRAAWEGMIAAAIEHAANDRRVSDDWVLTGGGSEATSRLAQGREKAAAAIDEKIAADHLKQRLTARYFAEYTAAWQRMLNSLQWQPAANLSGAIEQLTRLADAQTSPLIALMKSIGYQAQAGRASQALADTLVRKAQSLVSRDDQATALTVNPLDKSFGPLLSLMEDASATAGTDKSKGHSPSAVSLIGVSLPRYLTAVTTMRLKLQQIASSADAQTMARSLAQAVFQGKLSELSQARDDAALTAASLGTAWAGFGDAVFTHPLEAAWQTILQPAAASLNGAWRASIAAPFNTAMDGRYPFYETGADASLAELGRFVRPDTGLIAKFIATQLAGVLKQEGDVWTPNELAPQALQFDPKFLESLCQLSKVGAQLYVQGDAGERFEMMALPTPGVTHSELSVDKQQLAYFNQQQSWTPMSWPGDGLSGHARLTWQTVDTGLRQAFDASGDWAFLRMLDQAQVKALDSTRYQLTWNSANGVPLSYVLRSQLGAGPIDLLKLRGFRMPERIFVVGKSAASHTASQPSDERQP